MKRAHLPLLLSAGVLLLGACDAQEARPTRLPPPVLDSSDVTDLVDTRAVPKDVMTRLLEQVAADSGVRPGEVVVERAERATWGDTSLGCPQPNRDYLQRVVRGYWVVLHAAGQEYDYRVDSAGGAQRCTGATRQAPIVYPSDT